MLFYEDFIRIIKSEKRHTHFIVSKNYLFRKTKINFLLELQIYSDLHQPPCLSAASAWVGEGGSLPCRSLISRFSIAVLDTDSLKTHAYRPTHQLCY